MVTTSPARLSQNKLGYGANVGTNISSGTGNLTSLVGVGITTDASKSGIVADLSSGAVVIIKY